MQTIINFLGFAAVVFLGYAIRENGFSAGLQSFWRDLVGIRIGEDLAGVALVVAGFWLFGMLERVGVVICDVLPIVTVAGCLGRLVGILIGKRDKELAFVAHWVVAALMFSTVSLVVELSNVLLVPVIAYVISALTVNWMRLHDPEGIEDWMGRHPKIAGFFFVAPVMVAEREAQEGR